MVSSLPAAYSVTSGKQREKLLMKLITKADFARMLEVTGGAVTKMVRNHLARAMVGNKIDMGHEDTINFLQQRNQQPVATGIDPLYQQAVDICIAYKKISVRLLTRELRVGQTRVNAIIKMIKLGNPQLLTAPKPPPPPAPPPPPRVKPTRKIVALQKLSKKITAPPVAVAISTRKKDALQQLAQPQEESQDDGIPEDIRAFIDFTLREIIARFGSDVGFNDFLKATKTIEEIAAARLKNAKTAREQVSIDLVQLGVIEPINAVFRSMLTDGAKTIATTVFSMAKSNATLVDCELEIVQHMTKMIKTAKQKMAKAIKDG